jgi:molecular chaperone DnaK (HSP70)
MFKNGPEIYGLDLGDKWCNRAFIANGVSRIYVDQGSRKTRTTVAFVRGQRVLGKKSKAPISSPKVNSYGSFKVKTLASLNEEEDTELTLSWASAFAPFVKSTQQLTVSCPACWGYTERLQYHKAALVAGTPKIHLVREVTALAVHYYFHRLVGTEFESKRILFIDSGHSETKAALVQYDKTEDGTKHLTVLEHFSMAHISGYALDRLICDFIAAKYGLPHNQALMTAAEGLKIKLGMNKVADYFYEQEERSLKLTREEYSELTYDYWASMQKLDVSCDMVEVVGGNMRSPLFMETLAELYPETPIQKTNDAEESVASGCALWHRLSQIRYRNPPLLVFDLVKEAFSIRQNKRVYHLAKVGQQLPLEQKFEKTLAKLTSPACVYVGEVLLGEISWENECEDATFGLNIVGDPDFKGVVLKYAHINDLSGAVGQEQEFEMLNNQIIANQDALNALETFMFANRDVIPEVSEQIEARLCVHQENIATDAKIYGKMLEELRDAHQGDILTDAEAISEKTTQ